MEVPASHVRSFQLWFFWRERRLLPPSSNLDLHYTVELPRTPYPARVRITSSFGLPALTESQSGRASGLTHFPTGWLLSRKLNTPFPDLNVDSLWREPRSRELLLRSTQNGRRAREAAAHGRDITPALVHGWAQVFAQ